MNFDNEKTKKEKSCSDRKKFLLDYFLINLIIGIYFLLTHMYIEAHRHYLI